jgi:hypothetical protein
MFIAGVGIMAGCASKHKLVAGAPDWVNRGSGAFEEAGDKVFYGVGAVTGVNSQPLATQAADQRARADIAKQLDTYVANLYRDYQTSTAAAMGNKVMEEQHVEETLKTFSKISVRGARVLDHWKDPETNTIYSLTRIDLEGIKATLKEMQEMDPGLRNFVRSNAEKAFEEIQKEEKGR